MDLEPINPYRGRKMAAERAHKCWEIMQCGESSPCPVRMQNISRCWEWMSANNEFQCQYGLCEECIVYLCNNENTILSDHDLEQAMISRGLYEEDISLPGLRLIV